MTNPILITGASGNVGSVVLKILEEKKATVRAAVRSSFETVKLKLEPEETVEFDFLKPSTFEATFKDVKKIFLMRPPALSHPEKDMLPALLAAKKAGVTHITFLSLLGAEKNEIVPHAKIERLILSLNFSYTFLRPSFFMQNISTTHAVEIREQNELFVPAGNGKTSFIDVRDIAEVAALALLDDSFSNQALPLTGSLALSYGEVAEILSRELGRKIEYRSPSLLRFVIAMRKRKFDWTYIAVMCAIYTVNRLGKAATVTDEVEKILKRKPSSFEAFAHANRSAWI